MISELIKNELADNDIFGAVIKRLLFSNLIYALAFLFSIIFFTALLKKINGSDHNLFFIINGGFFGAALFILITTSIFNRIVLNLTFINTCVDTIVKCFFNIKTKCCKD